jgi:hypothetical protein
MQAINFVFVPYPVPCAGVTHWRNRQRRLILASASASGGR